jgi:hypothetical protein
MARSQHVDAKELAGSLYSDIVQILEDDWGLYPISDLTISLHTLFEVAHATERAMTDLRLQYPKNITMIKYIATVAFWIIRCKPINSFLADQDGAAVDAPDINEHIALSWALLSLVKSARQGVLRELIRPTRRNLSNLDRIITYYKNGSIYRNVKTGIPVPDTTKYKETIYYFRYKKITAVFIYEILVHLLVSYKALSPA